jgi:hypothetical protein
MDEFIDETKELLSQIDRLSKSLQQKNKYSLRMTPQTQEIQRSLSEGAGEV